MKTPTLTTRLAILQQSEYDWPSYLEWYNRNDGDVIEPKQWTLKLRLLETLTKLTSVFIPINTGLCFWSQVLRIPQSIIVTTLIFLATLKLRFLQSQGMVVIAIAGSYGKTSTKFIVHHVLSKEKNTLMTPDNINTPIGIARTILNTLNGSHKYFIAELGEYYPGDIASLTRFVRPAYKILTPIGFAHLGKFKTNENLEKGLLELLLTSPNTPAITHEVNTPLLQSHAVKTSVSFYGSKQLQDISVSRAGTEYTILEGGKEFACFIPLFGEHNAVNTLPTVWLSSHLGIPIERVVTALFTLPHIPHRLEPTYLEQNILVLDNGYNSNPASSIESLKVLQAIEGSQKIVCTPGFVDMGNTQERENKKLGEKIATVADICIVIRSVNHDAIVSGLKAGGMNSTQILSADTEEEGMNSLKEKIKPFAVILFENSVPALYK